jgi:hypothetical protein
MQALTGVNPVIFEPQTDTVTAFSVEDNDCYSDADSAEM